MDFLCRKRQLNATKKTLLAMSKAKEKRIREALSSSSETNICEGLRIVNLKELAKNLKCRQCSQLLDLSKVMKERLIGCHSLISIPCGDCKIVTEVNTAYITEKKVSEVNAGIVLGAMHSGAGQTALNKILACADLPPLSNDMYKNYEKLMGKAIEEEAKDSCKRAAMEERELVIKNIHKLIKEL